MTQTAISYAKALYELNISKQVIEETRDILSSVPDLKEVLASPVVSLKKKHNIIEKIFSKEIKNFLKVLCDYQSMEVIDEIFAEYHSYYNQKNGILEAKLVYVTQPDKNQLEQFENFLKKKYHKEQIEFELVNDPSILGGFRVEAANYVTDWSLKGRLDKLQQKLVRR